MEYGVHTSNAWMTCHDISIVEFRGRLVRWSIVRLILLRTPRCPFLFVPWALWRDGYYGGSPSRGFVIQRMLEDYYGSNFQPCFIHDGDVKSWPSRNSTSRIEPGDIVSKTKRFNLYHLSCLGIGPDRGTNITIGWWYVPTLVRTNRAVVYSSVK